MNSEGPSAPEELSLFSISVGEDLFAIETSNVREVLERPQMRTVPLCPRHIVGVMPYRGEILTTVSFRALLGRTETQAAGCVIVLEDERTGELWGLSVDAAHGVLAALQPNPPTFGRMIRLDPNRLKPEQPAATGTFFQAVGRPGKSSRGDSPCAH